MQGKGSMINKQQDELAYLKFVEDVCRFSLLSPQNYPLLLTVKTCLHKCFLSQPRYIDAVVTGIKTCVGKLTENAADDVDVELLKYCVARLEVKQSAAGDKSMVVTAAKDELEVK